MSRRDRVEGAESSTEEYTFEEFETNLARLRQIGSEDILKTIAKENIPETRKENYLACVRNFKERSDLLDKFTEKLTAEEKILNEFIVKHEQNIECKVEVMQRKSKLKNVLLFLQVVDAEKKREQFYKTTAMEKYMANHLEITPATCPQSS